MSDRPRPKRDLGSANIAALVCWCGIAGAVGMLWVAFNQVVAPVNLTVNLPPATPYATHLSPQELALFQGQIIRLTETAPTPTWTPTPYAAPTTDPTHFCGIDSVAGQVCRWPEPTLPPPTPYPDCGIATPATLCIWRQS